MAKGLPVIPGADIKLGRQEGAENQNWVGVNIYGDDPSKLQDIAREARTRFRARPGFSEIHTDSDKMPLPPAPSASVRLQLGWRSHEYCRYRDSIPSQLFVITGYWWIRRYPALPDLNCALPCRDPSK